MDTGTLIKVVAEAIPTYVMSNFKLPTKINKELDALKCNFLWAGSGKDMGIHYFSKVKL